MLKTKLKVEESVAVAVTETKKKKILILKTNNNEELKVEESVAVTETETKKMLILKTNDNEEFEVEESVAIQAVTIKNMVEDDCASNVIPLPNVTSKTLAKVIEYLKSHANSKASDDDLRNFDKEFLQTSASNSLEEIFALTLAANYLNISGLLDIICQKIADSIKDLSVEDVRQCFNIENDFTPEEEEKIRNENSWAYE